MCSSAIASHVTVDLKVARSLAFLRTLPNAPANQLRNKISRSEPQSRLYTHDVTPNIMQTAIHPLHLSQEEVHVSAQIANAFRIVACNCREQHVRPLQQSEQRMRCTFCT